MAYDLSALRFLVIDDNSHIRSLLRTILQSLGVREIETASDGISGFDTFIRLEFDIIITDLEMEPMSGIQFIDLVRTSRKSPNPMIPLIAITALADRERVTAARDRGVTEFLAKPFTVENLVSKISAIIENPRSFIRTKDYFGPDRRRHSNKRYTGPERRKQEAELIESPRIEAPDINKAKGKGNKSDPR